MRLEENTLIKLKKHTVRIVSSMVALTLFGCTNTPVQKNVKSIYDHKRLGILNVDDTQYNFCSDYESDFECQKTTKLTKKNIAEIPKKLVSKTVVANKDSINNKLVETIEFDNDSSFLRPMYRKKLLSFKGLIGKDYSITLKGFTDSVASKSYNQKLAMKRAKSVHNYLSEIGLNKSYINLQAYGKCCYLNENRNNNEKQKNRRVEVYLTLR